MIFDRLLNRVIACLHIPRVTEKVAARYELLRGDLNYGGILTPADAAIALTIAATGTQNPAADVSGDDCVTSLDALTIMQAAGAITI